jgi:hypothetical protein
MEHCEICKEPDTCVVCELSGEPRPVAETELDAVLEDAANWSRAAAQEHERAETIQRDACTALIGLIKATWNIDAVRNSPAMEAARAFVQTHESGVPT